jgi:polar amino acid transport system substrate-binding protein
MHNAPSSASTPAVRQNYSRQNSSREETLPALFQNLCPGRTSWRRFMAHFVAATGLTAIGLSGFALWLVVSPVRAQNAEPPAWPVVRIASEGARPPYNFLDNNELAGFEIDLGRAICARLAIKCLFVAQDWDNLIPGLLNHQYDAIMAAMEITDKRREKIAFSAPYVRMPSAFAVTKTSPLKEASPVALAGKTIGVEAGGTHQTYLEDLYKNSEIHPYSVLLDAILDLADGRIDTVIGDKDAIADFLATRKEGQCCRILADVPRDETYFGAGIGIGLRKEDKSLKTMFDKALDELMADGTFAKISSKYFNFEIK